MGSQEIIFSWSNMIRTAWGEINTSTWRIDWSWRNQGEEKLWMTSSGWAKSIRGNECWIDSDALGMKKRESMKGTVWIIYKMLKRVEEREQGSHYDSRFRHKNRARLARNKCREFSWGYFLKWSGNKNKWTKNSLPQRRCYQVKNTKITIVHSKSKKEKKYSF